MQWKNVNREDAMKDTFGATFESGAYEIDIKRTTIFRSNQSDFASITLEADINGSTKYIKLVTQQSDGSAGYDSRRVMQLCMILGVPGEMITEVATDDNRIFEIPQLKGKAGCIVEYKPKHACKPSHDGNQYPEYKAVQFFYFNDKKTISERVEKKDAVKVDEIVEQLQKREYEVYKGTGNTNETKPTPQPFNVGADLTESDMPF